MCDLKSKRCWASCPLKQQPCKTPDRPEAYKELLGAPPNDSERPMRPGCLPDNLIACQTTGLLAGQPDCLPDKRIACQAAGLLARQPDCLPDCQIACKTAGLLARQPDCLLDSRIAEQLAYTLNAA
jgi:hypothetical protein